MSIEARLRVLEARVAALERQLGATPSGIAEAAPATEPQDETPAAPVEPRPDLETHLATTWLNRVGIVALVAGIALLLVYALPSLGAAGKLLAGFACGAGLAGLGLHLRRRYRLFGQVLFAGGMALLYFDTYALHFVPALQVIDSPLLALALMSLLVLAIVVAAQRMDSEGVAGIALFLGYATAVIAQTTAFTLVSLLLLGAASIVFLVVNRWVIVPISSLVAVYLTHMLWMVGYPVATLPSSAGISLAALALYFTIFGLAPLVGRRGLPGAAQAVMGGLNWFGLFSLGGAEVLHHHPGGLWLFCLLLAGATLGLAAAANRRQQRALAEIQAVLALVSLGLALAAGLPLAWLPLAWGLLGLAALYGGRALGPASLQVTGVSLGLLAATLQLALVWGTRLPAPLLVACLVLMERTLRRERGWQRGLGITVALTAGVLLLVTLAALSGGQWLTVAWLVAALGLFGGGLLARDRLYRLCALAVLGLALLKVVIYDLAQLTALLRIGSVVLLGLVLLVVSFLYTRLEGRLGSA